MSEPIKVSRAQWDAAFERQSEGKRCSPLLCRDASKCGCRAAVEKILGPRPAPDTPPDIEVDGLVVACASKSGGVYVETNDLLLLLPWVEDHLLPWLRAMTKEDRC